MKTETDCDNMLLTGVIPGGCVDFLSFDFFAVSPFTALSRDAVSGLFVAMVTDAVTGRFTFLLSPSAQHNR